MSKKPEYYTDYVDGDYDPTLFGPDGFECYLGEPEDRTFYRDAAPMVNKLNEQADHIKQLESRTQWQPIETYDKLKVKPKFSAFYVEATKPTRHDGCFLREMVVMERHFGNRTITKWYELPESP